MLNFIARFFGTPRRRPHRPARTRPGVEALNDRVLPHAGFGGFAGAFGQAALVRAADAGTGAADFAGGGCHGHGAEQATLSASLSNGSGATGTATFSDVNGVLNVSVTGAAISSTLNVTATDATGATSTLGTVATDASGNGHAKFTGVTLAAGDTITVGDLTGTFAQVKFTASLTSPTSATGVTGTAKFNSVRDEISVSARGLTAGTTYTVAVNGTTVGTIGANARGRGELSLTLPTGVTITAGTTLAITAAVGTAVLSGTFA